MLSDHGAEYMIRKMRAECTDQDLLKQFWFGCLSDSSKRDLRIQQEKDRLKRSLPKAPEKVTPFRGRRH